MKNHRQLNQVQKAFLITSLILLIQIVRNISNIGYIGVLFSSYAWLYISYFLGNKKAKTKEKSVFKPMRLIFLLSILWIPFISLLNMEINEFAVALPRYLVTLPYLLFCYFYKGYNLLLAKKVLKLFIFVTLVGSISIPYQIVFGPISFFADVQWREGLIRYSSFLGSLTALGTLCGVAIGMLLFSGNFLFRKKTKIVIIFMIVIGSLMTLQKAAVVNLIICVALYYLTYGEQKWHEKSMFLALGLVAAYILSIFVKDLDFIVYIERIIKYTFSDSSVGVSADMINRIWFLPSRVVTYNNMTFIDYILGIGFPALAGTMGNPQYPMAHNNYFDLLFSGGILHLVSYVYLLLRVPFNVMKKTLKRRKLTSIDRMYTVSSILILINMLIGAAIFYQPVIAVVVYFIIFSYEKLKNIEIIEYEYVLNKMMSEVTNEQSY